MSIFKAYDIRGVYGRELNETVARAIGQAFGLKLKIGPIAVGHDMRESSPSLSRAIIEGIADTGNDVTDIGLCSTPMLNFAVARYDLAGGVMVTASHNPGRYNGFKLCREKGIPLSQDTGIADLETWVTTEAKRFEPCKRRGRVTSKTVIDDYQLFFESRARSGPRALKIAVDCGNGITGPYEYGIISMLYRDTRGIYLEPDGRFPHHEANPIIEENLTDLKAKVKAEGCHLGLAFDGDGDRVAFVDENGQAIAGDLVLALLAREMLVEHPGAVVLYDLRSSWAVREEIERAGGIAVLSRVGHAFIKKTLREREGILGGELSGHFYFKDFFFLDSGIFAALKVLETLSREATPLSEMIRPLDRYPRTGELNFIVDDPDRILFLAGKMYSSNGCVTRLDGLSIEFDDWWFNLRKSNTESLLRLNLQARDAGTLKEKLGFLKNLIGGRAA